MKYTKPATRNSVVLLNFLDSLPAEFEIVQPGMTQVRWPDGATREAITDATAAVMQQWKYPQHELSSMLGRIAAIAPKEKKKRKMKVLVTLDFGTHKVGPIESECEVTG